MFFFFHRYELPVILQQAEFLARRNDDDGEDGDQPPQQQRRQRLGTSRLVNRFFGRLQQQRQQQGQVDGIIQNQEQHDNVNGTRHLQLLGALLLRRGENGNAAVANGGQGGGLHALRHAFLARVWNSRIHVQIQVRNLQRLPVEPVQIQPNAVNTHLTDNNLSSGVTAPPPTIVSDGTQSTSANVGGVTATVIENSTNSERCQERNVCGNNSSTAGVLGGVVATETTNNNQIPAGDDATNSTLEISTQNDLEHKTDIMVKLQENCNNILPAINDETATAAGGSCNVLLNSENVLTTTALGIEATSRAAVNNGNMLDNNNIGQLENEEVAQQPPASLYLNAGNKEVDKEVEVDEQSILALAENDVKITTVAMQPKNTLPLLD